MSIRIPIRRGIQPTAAAKAAQTAKAAEAAQTAKAAEAQDLARSKARSNQAMNIAQAKAGRAAQVTVKAKPGKLAPRNVSGRLRGG